MMLVRPGLITEPNGAINSSTFTILPCVNRAAMTLSLSGGYRIAPTATATFYLTVMNLGVAPSAAVNV